MRPNLLAFLVLVAVLFGSTVAPALAHEGNDSLMHVGEVIDVHGDELSVSDRPGSEDDDGAAPTAAFHHHCACATKADHVTPLVNPFCHAQMFSAARIDAMASRRLAPLTEPPSA